MSFMGRSEKLILAGALVLGPAFGLAADSQTPKAAALVPANTAARPTMPATATVEPLTEVLAQAFQSADLVHMGDTDHKRNSDFQQWLGRPETMAALKAEGVKGIFLEVPQTLQVFADGLWLGQDTPDRFIEIMGMMQKSIFRDSTQELREYAVIIQEAAKNDIRVWFADPGTGRDAVVRLERLLHDTPFHDLKTFSAMAPEQRLRIFESLPTEKCKAISDAADAIMQARLGDASTAAFVRRVLPQGAKGLMFYGARHGSGKDDLNEHLRDLGIRSVKIDVFPDQAEYDTGIADEIKADDPPQGYYVLGTQTFRPAPSKPIS